MTTRRYTVHAVTGGVVVYHCPCGEACVSTEPKYTDWRADHDRHVDGDPEGNAQPVAHQLSAPLRVHSFAGGNGMKWHAKLHPIAPPWRTEVGIEIHNEGGHTITLDIDAAEATIEKLKDLVELARRPV